MINNLLFAAANTVNPGIVVLIGVVVVFLILLFLVGIVKLLKFSNTYMDKWDAMMLIFRGNRAEVASLKKSFIDTRDEALNDIYISEQRKEITKQDAKSELAKIKAEFNTVTKPIMLKAISDLKASQKAKSTEATDATQNDCVCANGDIVTDPRLIAAITAAIAIATEQECAERKVKFKVRTIKHLN